MRILSLVLALLFAPIALNAQPISNPDDEEEVYEEEGEEELSPEEEARLRQKLEEAGVDPCALNPYAQGCLIFKLGISLDFDTDGLIFGPGVGFGIFVFERLAFTLNASAVFYPNDTTYDVGPDLEYYIGPGFGWYLVPGLQARHLWVTGTTDGTAILYGPGVSLLTPFSRHLTIGISVYYIYISSDTFAYADGSKAQTQIGPIISFAF